ncbi:MAG: hypothetical protein V2J07_05000 [Anaerolineae bacterium]|nr:hypothetical protein [Anaerolineae bacterium]
MITFGELITGTTFTEAARQGWKEITNIEIPANLKLDNDFWDAMQHQAERYPYEQTRIGLAFRAGRCGFHAFLDLTGEEIGLRTPDYRLYPVQKKIIVGFEALGRLVCQSGFNHLQIETESGYCIQYGETLSEVQCGYLMGFFQEFLEWASQGRTYPIIHKEMNGFCFADEPLNL